MSSDLTTEQSAAGLLSDIVRVRDPRGKFERIYCVVVQLAEAAQPSRALPAHYVALLQSIQQSGDAPRGLVALDRNQAKERLARTIGLELAYGYELMRPATASFLAERFVALFASNARFYGAASDVRISRANFDAGIAATDGQRRGFVWVESDSPGR